MSSPSLPIVPQWLKPAFGVKRALAMVGKELVERNFGFDSQKSMNCGMLTAARCREAPPPRRTTTRQQAAGSVRFSLLQIDVAVEEPETSENVSGSPTQSFEIHNFDWRRTQLFAVI
ncbi:unnamed protein product [Boreogadus saida]